MRMFPNLMRSLLITAIFSFLLPVVLVGCLLVPLRVLQEIPSLEVMSQAGIAPVVEFLRVFGSGNPLHGLLVIASVSSLVGILFDSYTLYRHEKIG
ncbi:hypothetical protein HPC62_05255 [Thermoleptolyngbya sichuanensis A183]|uniref:Uncharacterized protein n=1 Tax=Thermoleptolyngbya sichuanensis A183 TaxID=2737172 RepID=A0A6M8BGE0_9CYAN|nr:MULTISPECIES: hypothetical protein [Thermoleptolyngbya]QKD81675.1 hypothetical protein HPC62_05255 [Thermoleptolyngbya sichuanensis A183]